MQPKPACVQIKCLFSAWDREHRIELFRGGPDSGQVLCAFLVVKEGISVDLNIMSWQPKWNNIQNPKQQESRLLKIPLGEPLNGQVLAADSSPSP